MSQTPEIKKPTASDQQDVYVHPKVPEIPEHIEKAGLMQNTASSQPFTAQVQDDQGNDLIFTPENAPVDIVIPDTVQVLEEEAKGNIEESGTWLANFFLRIIKKAIHFGRKIIYPNGNHQLVSDTNKV